jgi:hypothetical protein
LFSDLLSTLANNKSLVEFSALVLGVGTALAGTVATIATGTLVFIKLSAVISALSATLPILAGGIRLVAGATGIGLAIVAVALLIQNFDQVRAVGLATFEALKVVISGFVLSVQNVLGGLGQLLVGIFTLDTEAIKKGFAAVKVGVVDVSTNTAKEAAQAFKATYEENSKPDPNATAEAVMIAGETANEAALESIAVGGEEQRAAKDEQDLAEAERKRAAFEARRALELEQKALEDEEKALAREQDALDKELTLEEEATFNSLTIQQRIEFLEQRKKIDSDAATEQQKAEAKVLQDRLNFRRKANQQFLQDQIKFGTTFATINQAINTNEVQGFKKGTNELTALTQSKNSTLKKIGKAAAVSQILIKGAQGAMNAYSGFSVIPIVGVPLGIAAAAGVLAFSAEQIGSVLSAQQGGLITGGIPNGDSVPALLEPGELVTPQSNFEEVIGAVADARAKRTEGEEDVEAQEQSVGLEIAFEGDEASQVITTRQIEDRSLGISREAG